MEVQFDIELRVLPLLQQLRKAPITAPEPVILPPVLDEAEPQLLTDVAPEATPGPFAAAPAEVVEAPAPPAFEPPAPPEAEPPPADPVFPARPRTTLWHSETAVALDESAVDDPGMFAPPEPPPPPAPSGEHAAAPPPGYQDFVQQLDQEPAPETAASIWNMRMRDAFVSLPWNGLGGMTPAPAAETAPAMAAGIASAVEPAAAAPEAGPPHQEAGAAGAAPGHSDSGWNTNARAFFSAIPWNGGA